MVRKQALGNLILNYFGYGLGSLNYILLMPLFFSTTEIGLMRLLNTYAIVLGTFVALGSYVTLVRFFTQFKTPDGKHKGFITLLYLITALGFLILAGIFWVGKPFIMELYVQKSPLFTQYYYHLLPLVLFTAFFLVQESQASVIYQTLLPVFLKEVLLRALFTVTIFLFAFRYLSFDYLVDFFVFSAFLICLWQFIALMRSGRFAVGLPKFALTKDDFKDLFKFSITATLSNLVFQLIVNVDTIMLSTMAGLSIVGVYGIYTNIAMLISVPSRSILKITFPLISEAWGNKDYIKIQTLYAKTAILQTIASAWIYLMVIINDDNLFHFLNKPEYKDHFTIYIFLGLSYFINSLFGVNHTLIITSPLYRYDIVFNVVMLVLNTVATYVGIKLYGGEGAAIASCSSVLVINLVKWYFIRIKFKMEIFSVNYLKVFFVIVVLYLAQEWTPMMGNAYTDLILRSGLITTLFVLIHYYWKVSGDLNDAIHVILQKARNYLQPAK